jgi:hypothetical protein
MSKMSWADIADEEDLKSLEIPVVISKHGIKVKKIVSSPDKSSEPKKDKKNVT